MNGAIQCGSDTRPTRKSNLTATSLRCRWSVVLMGALFGGLGSTGCSLDKLLHSDALPKDVSDPAITRTPEGARAAYVGTLSQFWVTFGGLYGVVALTGSLSDELSLNARERIYDDDNADVRLDRRMTPEGGDGAGDVLYSSLQKVRGQGAMAIGLLTRYLSDQPALVGHVYALQGYAELFLAEAFCSGVPLGILDYEGDYTYQPGSTTDQVFAHAKALFDTAITLAGDSARFVDLARIGQGRALLARGDYAAAAAAVAAVPDAYYYDVRYSTDSIFNANGTAVSDGKSFFQFRNTPPEWIWRYTVSDLEGLNGLGYRTSGDPRTAATVARTVEGEPIYFPSKYDSSGASPIRLASGVEARLIEAEAALRQGDVGTWLAKLNALRTDGTFDITATSPPDTLWHAGAGGVAELAPLTDPGSAAERVDLLFHERAFWLFLTGHRQGDLRRLIRQYGRSEDQVYPIGPYPSTALPYASDVTMPIPATEFANPLYTGCASRGA